MKRFFYHELSHLGYRVDVDPMFTGDWNEGKAEYFRLIGVDSASSLPAQSNRTALFLDPDTGINDTGGMRHISYDRIALEVKNHTLVFSFDQSFSRQANTKDVMVRKIAALETRGCRVMYYDSHARFLFAAADNRRLDELRAHLVALGLPPSRLF